MTIKRTLTVKLLWSGNHVVLLIAVMVTVFQNLVPVLPKTSNVCRRQPEQQHGKVHRQTSSKCNQVQFTDI
jgi:hypothetical protein